MARFLALTKFPLADGDKIGQHRRQALRTALQPVVLDHDILALDKAPLAQPGAERGKTSGEGAGRPRVDDRDHRHRCLLRLRRERPCGRAANQCDEFPTMGLPSGLGIAPYHAADRLCIATNLPGDVTLWVIFNRGNGAWQAA
jgi:hypothetical protein